MRWRPVKGFRVESINELIYRSLNLHRTLSIACPEFIYDVHVLELAALHCIVINARQSLSNVRELDRCIFPPFVEFVIVWTGKDNLAQNPDQF